MAFGALALVIAAIVFENPLPVLSHAGPVGTIAIVYMALVGSVLAYMPEPAQIVGVGIAIFGVLMASGRVPFLPRA